MTAVLLFAKAPRVGTVKTRLAADLGSVGAVGVYRRLGRAVADAVAVGHRLTVWYDPPDAEHDMREWLGDHEFRPQAGADLGERMAHAFRVHFDRGDAPVIAVGADVPGLDGSTVDAACRELERADVVLGPALDGGYYLLGLNRYAEALFRGVPWGGSRVMRVTLAACAAHDLRVGRLAPRRDVDTAADLAALGLAPP